MAAVDLYLPAAQLCALNFSFDALVFVFGIVMEVLQNLSGMI